MLGFFDGQPPVHLYDGVDYHFVPRWLSKDCMHQHARNLRPIEVFESLPDFIRRKQPRTLCFYRTFALGDIIMLIPVLRALRRQFSIEEPLRVIVGHRFLTMVEALNRSQGDLWFLPSRGATVDYGCDVHMNLNSCLETDHHGGADSDLHRLELYGRALGVKVVKG